jgi:hypothetical protein
MGERVEAPAPVEASAAQPLSRARVFDGEIVIARLLRTGAVLSGMCFGGSLLLELLPLSTSQAYAIDALRRGGISLLMLTPLVRLVAAGILLGMRGEWRFALYAASVLLLLALAIGSGMSS